jgi:hypothetical protein
MVNRYLVACLPVAVLAAALALGASGTAKPTSDSLPAPLPTSAAQLTKIVCAKLTDPAGMPACARAATALAAYNEATNQLARAAATLDAAGDKLVAATKQMQETRLSFNYQYLQLQTKMQHENLTYTAISNIMKTKHDTVKNSISNIR